MNGSTSYSLYKCLREISAIFLRKFIPTSYEKWRDVRLIKLLITLAVCVTRISPRRATIA